MATSNVPAISPAIANASPTMASTSPTIASPKTVFCDIDGTLLQHHGSGLQNAQNPAALLTDVLETVNDWERLNYRIILMTGRRESQRQQTEATLKALHIPYDQLLMGLPNGDRVIINDRKPNSQQPSAFAISPPRNLGLQHVNLADPLVTLSESDVPSYKHIDKPWGYEEIVDVNHAYVVKKLMMRAGHACSIQYHRCKRETILVFSGKLRIYTGSSLDTLASRVYGPGETVTIAPYTIHRMEGVEDALYYETSTNELWDVVRLLDAYGRTT